MIQKCGEMYQTFLMKLLHLELLISYIASVWSLSEKQKQNKQKQPQQQQKH